MKLTTPIASVKITPDVVKEGDPAIYNLTGRRIEHITRPGIYISGGKKVIVIRTVRVIIAAARCRYVRKS